MSRPRVVAYLDSTEIGGAEKCLRSVVEGLDGSFAYTVAGNDANVVEWVAGSARAEQLVLPDAPTKTSFRPGWAHVRAFRRLRPDIVHVSLRHPYACQWGTVAGLLAPGAGVFAVEQLPIPPANRMQARIKRLLASRLDAHVAVGAAAARDLEGWVALQPGSVGTLYNARPSDPVTRSTPSKRRAALRRRRAPRRPEGLRSADRRAHRSRRGRAAHRRRRSRARFARGAGCSGRCRRASPFRRLGRRSATRAGARRHVRPSVAVRGASTVDHRGHVCRAPGDSRRRGQRWRARRGRRDGSPRSGNDFAAVAAAIRQLAGDRRRQRELGSAGRARALERFSLEAMLEHYRALYQELLA